MDASDAFWIAVFRTIAVVLVALIVTIGGCEWHKSYMVNEAVERGIDPIRARCGVNGIRDLGESAMCGAAAAIHQSSK